MREGRMKGFSLLLPLQAGSWIPAIHKPNCSRIYLREETRLFHNRNQKQELGKLVFLGIKFGRGQMLIVVVVLVTSPNVNTTINEQNDMLLPKVTAVTAVMSFVKSLAPLGLSGWTSQQLHQSQVELSFSYG